MKLANLIVFAAPLLFSASMLAHEGHDHKELKPVTMPDQMVVQETTTDAVELVLKHLMFEPGKLTPSRVFLSTADENKPIANANVEFEFEQLDGLKIKFAPEKGHPGVYSASVSLPKSGSFDATVSVSGENVSDLLTLSGIEVKSVSIAGAPSQITYAYLAAALALLGFGALLVILMIRRRKHA